MDENTKSLNQTDIRPNMLVTAFHPELTDDTRIHELFLNMVKENCSLSL